MQTLEFARLHDQFMLLQRRMRTVRMRKESPLHYLHGLILNHVSSDAELVASDIAQQFDIQTSRVSRILSELEEAGFIVRNPSPVDRRKNELHFTEEGRQLLSQLRSLSTEIVNEGFAELAPDAQQIIVHGLKKVADGMQIPDLPSYAGEHPLVPQQQRLIRGQAVLSNRYMGSSYTLNEYHILMELGMGTSDYCGFDELADTIPIGRSKLSRSITRLVQKGILRKKINAGDKRKVFISFSEKGQLEYDRLQIRFGEIFQKAFGVCTPRELEILQDAFTRLHAIPLLTETKSLPLKFSNIEGSQERSRVRAHLVENVVHRGLQHLLPEVLIATGSRTYTAEQDGIILGIVEVIFGKEQTTLNVLWVHPGENSTFRRFLVLQLLERALGAQQCEKTLLSDFACQILEEQRMNHPEKLLYTPLQ